MLSREERMKLHAEFMCALITSETSNYEPDELAQTAVDFAIKALAEYERYWEEEKV